MKDWGNYEICNKDMFRFQLADDLFLYIVKGGLENEYAVIEDSPYDGLDYKGVIGKEQIEKEYKITLK